MAHVALALPRSKACAKLVRSPPTRACSPHLQHSKQQYRYTRAEAFSKGQSPEHARTAHVVDDAWMQPAWGQECHVGVSSLCLDGSGNVTSMSAPCNPRRRRRRQTECTGHGQEPEKRTKYKTPSSTPQPALERTHARGWPPGLRTLAQRDRPGARPCRPCSPLSTHNDVRTYGPKHHLQKGCRRRPAYASLPPTSARRRRIIMKASMPSVTSPNTAWSAISSSRMACW